MTARLDRLSVVAPAREVGAAYVDAAFGMATHNLLLALGPTFNLEVIAPDPLAAPVPRPRWFGLDRLRPSLARSKRCGVNPMCGA